MLKVRYSLVTQQQSSPSKLLGIFIQHVNYFSLCSLKRNAEICLDTVGDVQTTNSRNYDNVILPVP